MSRQTLIVSFDCANAALLDAASASGALPTLASLRARGTWARTRGFALSAESDWHSFFTGCEPVEHGHVAYDEIIPGTYRSRLTTGSRSVRPPFFRTVAEAGARVVVVNSVHVGLMPLRDAILVENFHGHDAGHYVPLTTHPRELAHELQRRYPVDPVDPNDWGNTKRADPVRLLAGMRETLRRKVEVFAELLDRGPWDLAYLGLDECHELGHLFWHLHDEGHPRHGADARHAGFDPLVEMLGEMDAALGDLTAGVAEDCLVVVVSVAGVAGNYHWSHLVDTLLGRFEGEAAEPAGGYSRLRAAWNRLPHTVQRPLHLARHQLRENLLARARRRRRAFAMPLNEVGGGVRINLVGREPEGKVEPHAYDRTCHELIERFESLSCARTGVPLVRRIVKTADLPAGPYRDRMPDLVIDWNAELPIATVTSPFIGTVERVFDDARTGHHVNDGILLFAGDGEPVCTFPEPVPIADIGRSIVARHAGADRFGAGIFG